MTFDFEATDWNKLYSVAIYDGTSVKSIIDKKKDNSYFVEYLLDNIPNKEIAYAHYGGKYDFKFILDYIKKRPDIKITNYLFIHGSLVRFAIKYDHKKIEFRDSYNILPSSLKKLTIDFNVTHKKLSIDYELAEHNDNITEYIDNDVMGLYEVLQQSEVLTERLTVASGAMHMYIKRFYKDKPERNHDRIDDYFRNAYYGARVEIFKMYGKELNYYDVNSLYPYVMSKYDYPIIDKDNYIPSKTPSRNNGIYLCNVTCPKTITIPLLPVRHENKLIFPTGTWRGYYTNREIIKAREIGYKIDIISGYEFIENEHIFKEYVNHFYNIKKTSQGAKREIAKLMLNSLYGKFGQRRTITTYKLIDYSKKELPSVILGTGSGLDFYPTEQYNGYAPYLHSEIAAIITSNARLELYNLIEKAGTDNVYYCDTDSIITDTQLPTGTGLGELKNEHYVNEFIALAPKVYAIKSGEDIFMRAKGFNIDKIKYDDFRNALFNNDYSNFKSTFSRIATLSETIRNRVTNFSDLYELNRTFKNRYDKRAMVDGYNTKPLNIHSDM
jgi:hypothetical protein